LIEEGADVSAFDSGWYGVTALQAACRSGQLNVLNWLLEVGAYVTEPGGNNGNTHDAACHGSHLDVVRHLLAEGSEVNAKPAFTHGETALQAVGRSGRVEIVTKLLNNGAFINTPAANHYQGQTALQSTAVGSHLAVVKMLVDVSADVNVLDMRHKASLKLAVLKGFEDVVERLRQAGA
ncbi:ankyrin repeat-containing domain protein, partial [Calycina marina]